MTVFNGRYRWDGTKRDDLDPIAWFPGAYDVKILECSGLPGKVRLPKPYLCLYARTGEGQSISAHPEKFAKRLCRDFQLEIERVFWVEDLLTARDRYEVVSFIPVLKIGGIPFYRTAKRKASAHEVEVIENALTILAPGR